MEDRTLSIVAAEEELIAKAKKDGVETVWDRKVEMKTPCGFGSAGVCCRNCAMGPCRVSPVPGKGVSSRYLWSYSRCYSSKKFCKNVCSWFSSSLRPW